MPLPTPGLLPTPWLLPGEYGGESAAHGIIATKRTLTELIAAIPLLDGALVREGFPTDIPTETRRVYVMRRIEDGRRTPANQQGALTETYTIRLLIQARTFYPADTDGGTAERRAFAIFDAIDDMLRADDSIGGTVTQSVIETFTSETGVPDGSNDGWITEISVGIAAGDII